MKKILLLFASLASAATIQASAYMLQINLADGRSETFALDSKPTVTFSGSDMTVSTPEVTASYPRSNVADFKFIPNGSTGVESVASDIRYSYDGNVFSCGDLPISVFSLNGMLVASGVGSVDLGNLPSGIYIVNTNNKSIKIFRK